ncbi:MAG: hypothetical protein ACXWB0_04880 [Sulfuricurvum sp.]
MRRFAYWLFPTIALFVAIFVVAFMIQINPNVPIVHEVSDPQADSPSADEQSSNWMSQLHLNDEKGYFYPVNELSIQTDDSPNDVKIQRYHLMIHLKDSYEFFCLKQELKKTKFSYLLNQEGDSLSVEINSSDHNALSNLVTKLKTYQISAILSPL